MRDRVLRYAIFLICCAIASPVAMAGWCWNYSTYDADNPKPWACASDEGIDPGEVDGQTIRHEHRNWHCRNFVVFNEAYGRAFLAFHRQFILDFDNWRLENSSLGRLDIYEAGQNDPVPGNDESTTTPFSHCSTGTCTTLPCYCSEDASTPCDDDGDCSGTCEDIRPTATPCSGCSDLPATFVGDNLNDFSSLGEVGWNLEQLWHGSYHNGVSQLGCGDTFFPRTTTHDPAFWMAHKRLDEVARDWQSLQAADVVIVIDRSGSMDDNCSSTTPPPDESPCAINDAREAARTFADAVQDVRMEDGGVATEQHRIGLVSFSSTASSNVGLTAANGIVTDDGADNTAFEIALAGIGTGGATSIAAGIREAISMLDAVGDPNPHQAILVLTDGKENTAPCLEGSTGGCISGDVLTAAEVGQIQIVAIGLGEGAEEVNLRDVAERHGGIFVAEDNVDDSLSLQKFYVTAFGEIYDEGISLDPRGTMPAGARVSPPFSIQICDDTSLTVVLGREEVRGVQGLSRRSGGARRGEFVCDLRLELFTPSGALVDRADPRVEDGHGDRHDFLRVQLPYRGEGPGTWTGQIVRPPQSANCPRQDYFYSALSRGLGRVEPFAMRPNVIPFRNVLATFRITGSNRPHDGWDNVEAQVTLTRPGAPPATIALNDDGVAGDEVKGNNTWSAEFPLPARETGVYHLRGRFELTEGSCTKVREAEYSVVVTPEPEECSSLICDGVIRVRPGEIRPLAPRWCAWNLCARPDEYVVSIDDSANWLKTVDPDSGRLIDLPRDFSSGHVEEFEHTCFGGGPDDPDHGGGIPIFAAIPEDARPGDQSLVQVSQRSIQGSTTNECTSVLQVLGPPDCNANGIDDAVDIAEATSRDDNRDGVPDECDGSFGHPDLDLRVGPFVLSWNDLGAAVYDVIRGNLRRLRGTGGDFSVATSECLVDSVQGSLFQYAADPAPGEADWYLVRFGLVGGNGSYNSHGTEQLRSRDPGIAASGRDCP